MSTEPLYVDAAQGATLRHAGVSKAFLTLQEAVIAWHQLPPVEKPTTTIKVSGGPLYKAEEIERLHYGRRD